MNIEQVLKRLEYISEIRVDLVNIGRGKDRVIVDGGGTVCRKGFQDVDELWFE